jgi:hypothetical protein
VASKHLVDPELIEGFTLVETAQISRAFARDSMAALKRAVQ